MFQILNNKIYLIVSKWAYPFGGGEEFLYDGLIDRSAGCCSFCIDKGTIQPQDIIPFRDRRKNKSTCPGRDHPDQYKRYHRHL